MRTFGMPGDELVVSDTSPLLNLALVDRLDLLHRQFGAITVPEQVCDELLAGEDGTDELIRLLRSDLVTRTEVPHGPLYIELTRELDAGEAAALAFAIENEADLVLIDEQDGRRVARRHRLDVTGVIGILLKGARAGELDIETALDDLREAGFWIGDDLYRQAVDSAESD
jgi:uncharacterized protein